MARGGEAEDVGEGEGGMEEEEEEEEEDEGAELEPAFGFGFGRARGLAAALSYFLTVLLTTTLLSNNVTGPLPPSRPPCPSTRRVLSLNGAPLHPLSHHRPIALPVPTQLTLGGAHGFPAVDVA